jgi:hypothetical protein
MLGSTLGIFYIQAGGVCLFFALRNDVKRVFTIFALPGVHRNVYAYRYRWQLCNHIFFMPYLMIGLFLVMFVEQEGRAKNSFKMRFANIAVMQ